MHTTGIFELKCQFFVNPLITNDTPNIFRQRSAWQVELVVNGKSGHGSRYFKDTAGEKMTRLLAKINEFRDQEQKKFAKASYPYYGNITTINLTILKGGVQYNVIPAEMKATFDMRNSVQMNLNDVEQQVSHKISMKLCVQLIVNE